MAQRSCAVEEMRQPQCWTVGYIGSVLLVEENYVNFCVFDEVVVYLKVNAILFYRSRFHRRNWKYSVFSRDILAIVTS